MNPIKAFITTICSIKTASKRLDVNSIYDIKINTLQLEAIDLSEFKGKYILFVNVASKCGFTKQYRELQELSERFKKKLQVIGVPCNQFGNQEPGNSETIKSFCQVNYGVTFLITEKLHVKGKDQHPLYTWLTQKANNGIKDSAVKWNFQKYLINEKGDLVDYFHPATKPLSSKIVKHLK